MKIVTFLALKDVFPFWLVLTLLLFSPIIYGVFFGIEKLRKNYDKIGCLSFLSIVFLCTYGLIYPYLKSFFKGVLLLIGILLAIVIFYIIKAFFKNGLPQRIPSIKVPKGKGLNEVVKSIDLWAEKLYQKKKVNGIIAYTEADTILLKKELGYTNYTLSKKLDINTSFNLGENYYSFVVACIIQLKKENIISYDDLVSDYIEDLAYTDFTILDLLLTDHNLPNLRRLRAGQNLNEIIPKDCIKVLKERQIFLKEKHSEKHIRAIDIGHILLIEIIEVASNKTFSEFLSSNFLIPLKLDDTFVWGTCDIEESDKKNQAEEFEFSAKKEKESEQELFYYHNKVYSSLKDLLKWIDFWRNESGFIEEIKKYKKKEVGGNRFWFQFGWYTNGETFFHSSVRTSIWFDKERSLIFLSNFRFKNTRKIVKKIYDVLINK